MNNPSENRLLLVGDNPFLNISHLSQSKARERIDDPGNPIFAAHLLRIALDNGANGFTFSMCDSNLSILDNLDLKVSDTELGLYPVVPYAFEYVQKATQLGGFSGLVKKLAWDVVKSGNAESLFFGILTTLTANPSSLLKAYLGFELIRLDSHLRKGLQLKSVLLHQLVTDMALALDLEWLFKEYVAFMSHKKIKPGFNTGNFPFLVRKFMEWDIDLNKVIFAAPFNKVGFQMTPSIEACEKALTILPEPAVIAISILAAGYLQPLEASEYIAKLPNVRGIAIGISKEKQAKETFAVFKRELGIK